MNYLEITKREIEVQTILLEQYKELYENLPEGRLTTKKVNGNLFYYHVDRKTQKATYLSLKKNRQLIMRLKQKRWLEESIKIMEGNLRIQQKVLKQYKDYRCQSVQKRLSASYQDATIDQLEKKYLFDVNVWITEAYRKNPYHEKNLRYETTFGLWVRSKSELIIAELLHKYNIPFRYDARVRIQDSDHRWKTYYVDFVIMTPNEEEILWEHFGLMSSEEYRKGAFEKITDYFSDGYYVPNNFIITMDGPDGEFDNAAIQRLIEGQLVPLFAE